MKLFLLDCVFVALCLSCVSKPLPPEKEVSQAPPPAARQFLDTSSVVLADRITGEFQAELYHEVKYRADHNFHRFQEDRSQPAQIILTLENTSGLPNQPVKLWVGALQLVATGSIRAVFSSVQLGFQIEAQGEVLWKQGERSVRGQKISFLNGRVDSTDSP